MAHIQYHKGTNYGVYHMKIHNVKVNRMNITNRPLQVDQLIEREL